MPKQVRSATGYPTWYVAARRLLNAMQTPEMIAEHITTKVAWYQFKPIATILDPSVLFIIRVR